MTRAVFHDVVIAESDDVRVVQAMTYFARTSVKPDVLVESATTSRCFWKGKARYWDVAVQTPPEPTPRSSTTNHGRSLVDSSPIGLRSGTAKSAEIPWVIAGVVLVVLSVWAFTGPTSESGRTAAGVRVDPSQAYNPVLAGETLPDGFRQLLPRDAIKPIYDPQFVTASQVTWLGATDVIGVRLGDEAKAYPVSFLSGRELVIDELDGIPILVSW